MSDYRYVYTVEHQGLSALLTSRRVRETEHERHEVPAGSTRLSPLNRKAVTHFRRITWRLPDADHPQPVVVVEALDDGGEAYVLAAGGLLAWSEPTTEESILGLVRTARPLDGTGEPME